MKNVIRFVTTTSKVCNLIIGVCGTIAQCISIISSLKDETKEVFCKKGDIHHE